jgi:protein-tyrosine-phosphatase
MQIHSASCAGITRANVLMEKAYMVDDFGPLASFPNMWVLCRWVAPPSIEEWKASMGTDIDYPSHVRYLPVGKDGHGVVCIPPRTGPEMYPEVSRLVVRMMTQNIERYKQEQANKEIKRELPRLDARGNMIEEPHKGSKFWQVRDRIKNSRPTFDIGATVGYGGKTQLGHKPSHHNIHRSDRSLADPSGKLAQLMRAPVDELKEATKELINGNS